MTGGPGLFIAMVACVALVILLLAEMCGGRSEEKPETDQALSEAEALSREVAELKKRLVLAEKGR